MKDREPVDHAEDRENTTTVPQKNTLEELLALVNRDNIHDPVDTGPSVGKEI